MKTPRPLLTVVTLLFTVFASSLSAGTNLKDAGWSPLQRAPELLASKSNAIKIADVRWGLVGEKGETPVFKNATVNPQKIKDVYFWAENFPPEWLAAHGMIAFVFEDDASVVAEDGTSDIGLVLSVEARLKATQSYSLSKGLGKNFGLVYLLSTLSDRIQFAITMRKHSMTQYKLKLSHEQKVELVRNTIERSCENRDDVFYNTLTESCVTHATECINTVLPKDQQLTVHLAGRSIPNLLVSFPKTTGPMMVKKGFAEKIDGLKASDRELRYEMANGEDYVIDIRRMPGFGVSDTVLPFYENMEIFMEYAHAQDMLERLLEILSPMEPRFFEYQKELMGIRDELDICVEGLLKLLEENFEPCLVWYLTQETPDYSAVTVLNGMLAEQIHLRKMNGESFERINPNEALKKLETR